MGAINWTKEQLAVINSVDTDTLVSASAGSGKTAVMIERVVRIITGENCKQKTPLRRIIMVTFNESVASELKSKISAELAKKLAGSLDKDYIRKQIEDVAIADISTVHSLCSMIIKNNFEYLGIQPSFSIVDDEEKKSLFGKAITEVMKEYRENYDYQVDILINFLGGESKFCDTLSRLYGFLEAQLDREAYLDSIALSNYDGDFKSSPLAKRYMAELRGVVFEYIHQGRQWQTLFESAELDKHIYHVGQIIEYLNKLYEAKDIEELADVVKYSPKLGDTPLLPKSKKDEYADRQENYKAYKSNVVSLMKKLAKFFPKPYAQMQAGLDANKSYVTLLLDILKKVYNSYAALKSKDNRMDFADLEHYAVKAMQNDEIAKELAGCYDYICVDEYQDINPVQEYVLTRLSNGRNTFMVGDIKQSIYQFRMTDPKIFLDKYRRFKQYPQQGSAFSLNSNYRSCKEVIDFVNEIFDVVMKEDMGGIDYKKESRLLQGNLSYEEQSEMPIRIARFDKDKQELEVTLPLDGVYSVRQDAQEGKLSSSAEGRYVAKQIKSLVGKKQIQVSTPDGAMTYRPIKYSDIAILCSTRSANVASIVDELKYAGIPVDSAKILNEKTNSCVSLFASFARVVDNYRQDIPLTEILTSKVFADFSYKDMADIRAAYRKETFFHQAVDRYRKEQDDALAHKLNKFFDMLDRYRKIACFTCVSDLFRMLVADFNYREYMTSVDNGASELSGLESFISSLSGKPYNSDFPKFIEAADATSDFCKVSGEVGYEGDCVVTNTIHSSKGLEYPIVFIVDASKEVNLSDLNSANLIYDKTYGMAIKSVEEDERCFDDALPLLILRELKAKDVIEEKMRLFYVATTRARNMLYITATGSIGRSPDRQFGERKVNNPMSMLDWLNNVAVENKSFADKYYDYAATQEYVPSEQEQDFSKRKLVDLGEAETFAKSLNKTYAYLPSTTLLVKHTVTAVNDEYYNSLAGEVADKSIDLLDVFKDGDYSDEQVEAKRNSADEGVAYHRVMECIDYDCFTLDDVIAQLDSMVEQGLLSEEQRGFISPKSILGCLESEVMQKARKSPHYREKQFMLNLPAKEFLQVDSDDKVLLQGTVDLFIHGGSSDGENILVDFKFSRKSKEQLKKRYCKQLELYALALEECLGIKVDKKIIFVLGRNEVIEV